MRRLRNAERLQILRRAGEIIRVDITRHARHATRVRVLPKRESRPGGRNQRRRRVGGNPQRRVEVVGRIADRVLPKIVPEVMIDRDSWGCSYSGARGEIL